MTPPMMPVLLVLDGGLQEDPISPEVKARLRIPKLTLTSPPQGDAGAVAETARLLVAAQNPVIIADRLARTPAGMAHLVELAELLQAPVIDQGGRMNFPTQHPLNMSNGGRAADRQRRRHPRPRADGLLGDGRLVPRLAGSLLAPADQARDEVDQHHGRRPLHEEQLSGLPAVSRGGHRDGGRRRGDAAAAHRGGEARDHERSQDARSTRAASDSRSSTPTRLDRSRSDAAYAWDASPISTARLSAELWNVIKNEDWTLVSASGNTSNWDEAPLEVRQALPVDRRVRRRGRRLRRARGRRRARSRTRSTAASRSPSRATATSCMRPASVDGRASQASRCSR